MVHAQLGLRHGTLNRGKTKKHKPLLEWCNPKWDFPTELCINMRQQNILAFLIVALLLAGTATAYNGKQLAREAVDIGPLTDQNGEQYLFNTDAEGVVVVSFIFTRCPDVCPILTQSLIEVESSLTEEEREDVTFVSISVDPDHDTPEVLKEYTERMGASWPHLTGSAEDLEDVWAAFAVVVQQNVIDMHVADYQPGEASVTVIDDNNDSSQHMFAWSGWTATNLMAEEANWTLNTSVSEWGRMLHGINGVDSPADWSWYWELNLWNDTNATWEASNVGMDDLDATEYPHLAWMPSTSNRSDLPQPNASEASSVSVLWPNGTTAQQGLTTFNAYHLTEGALTAASVNRSIQDSSYGHFLSSLADHDAPEDYSWWWNLYAWNANQTTWESSSVGMDDFLEPQHIAWAPSYVNASTIPSPTGGETGNQTVCNGNGWEMGSGASKHCMCDEGYTWAEGDQLSCVSETTEDYNVGHSTITYILNDDLEPTVAWTGDNWRVEDFTADVREVLEKEQLGGNTTEVVPFMPITLVVGVLLMATVASRFMRSSNDQD